MATRHIVLSVLIFQREPNTWVVQALERDIAASGRDVDSAKRAFERTVSGYLEMLPKQTGDPLSALKPAPTKFWDLWSQLAEQTVEAERFPTIPAFMMPVVTYDPISA